MTVKSVSYSPVGSISGKMIKEVPPMFSPSSVSLTTSAPTVTTTTTATSSMKKIVGSTIVTPMGWNKRGRPSNKARPLLQSLTTTKVTGGGDIQGASLASSIGNVISLGSSTSQVGTQRSGVVNVTTKGNTPITTSIILSSSDSSSDTHQIATLKGGNAQGSRGGNAGVRVYSGSPKTTTSFLLTNVSSASSVRMASPSMVITNAMNLSSGGAVVSSGDSSSLSLSMGSVVVSAGGVSGSGSVVGAGRGRVILTSSPRLVRPFIGQGNRSITSNRTLNARSAVMLVTTATPPSTTTTTLHPVSRKASTLTSALTSSSLSPSTSLSSALTVASSIPISSVCKSASVPTGELALLVAASEMSERASNISPVVSSTEANSINIGNSPKVTKPPPAIFLTPQVTSPEENASEKNTDTSKIASKSVTSDIKDSPVCIDTPTSMVLDKSESFSASTSSSPQLSIVNSSPVTLCKEVTGGTVTTSSKHDESVVLTSTVVPVCSSILTTSKTTSKKPNTSKSNPLKLNSSKQTSAISSIVSTTNSTQTQVHATTVATGVSVSHPVIATSSISTLSSMSPATSILKSTLSTGVAKGILSTTSGSGTKMIITSGNAKSESAGGRIGSAVKAPLGSTITSDEGCASASIVSSNIETNVGAISSNDKNTSSVNSGLNVVISSMSKCPTSSIEGKTIITTTTTSEGAKLQSTDSVTKMTITTSVSKANVSSSNAKTTITTSTNKGVLVSSPKTTIITNSNKCPTTGSKTTIITTTVKASSSSDVKVKPTASTKLSTPIASPKTTTIITSSNQKDSSKLVSSILKQSGSDKRTSQSDNKSGSIKTNTGNNSDAKSVGSSGTTKTVIKSNLYGKSTGSQGSTKASSANNTNSKLVGSSSVLKTPIESKSNVVPPGSSSIIKTTVRTSSDSKSPGLSGTKKTSISASSDTKSPGIKRSSQGSSSDNKSAASSGSIKTQSKSNSDAKSAGVLGGGKTSIGGKSNTKVVASSVSMKTSNNSTSESKASTSGGSKNPSTSTSDKKLSASSKSVSTPPKKRKSVGVVTRTTQGVKAANLRSRRSVGGISEVSTSRKPNYFESTSPNTKSGRGRRGRRSR